MILRYTTTLKSDLKPILVSAELMKIDIICNVKNTLLCHMYNNKITRTSNKESRHNIDNYGNVPTL